MIWKALLISLITLVVAGYVLSAGQVAVPQIRYFAGAAMNRHGVQRIRVVSVREVVDMGNYRSGTTYTYKLVFTGGPLGHTREHLTIDAAPIKAINASGGLKTGSWIPAVRYFGKWLPIPAVKWYAVGAGGGSLLALGVIGLLLRCVVGPRAFPSHYEPATHDYSADFTGVPTLRPALIAAVGLLGFLTLGTLILGKRLVSPGSHFCYWVAILCLSLFLVSGPVVIWCVLPHFHRVRSPVE
ncbi:MAG: hypothetical protein ACYCUV_05920 [Phycisphaerae bacterium]